MSDTDTDTDTDTASRPFRAAAASIALTLVAVGASAAGVVVLAIPLLILEYDVTSPLLFLGLTAAGQVVFVGVAHAYRRWRDGWPAVPIAGFDRRDATVALGGAAVAVVVATGLSMIIAALNLAPSSVIGDAGIANPVVYLGLAVLSVVLVAPAEEYLFRGVVQGRLREAFGPAGAVAGSSLLFGSVHLVNYSGSVAAVLAGALLIAVVGVIVGASYEYTRNLAVPIALHALYNVTLLGVAYLTA